MAHDHRTRGRRRPRLSGVILAVMLITVLGGLAYLRAWPPFKVVMSASMEPAIETGDMVVMQSFGGVPEVGDIVAVPVPDEVQERLRYPEEVIHRVIEITGDGLVRTQGDNLPEPDPFGVPASSVRTRVVHVVPGVGRIVAFATSPYGLAWLVAGIVLFGVMPYFDSQRDLRGAVEEYGYHLRSHTAILESMSAASQELSATVVELRRAIAEDRAVIPSPARASSPAEPPPAPASPALYDDEMNPLVEPVSS